MAQAPIRVGIIGAGGIARNYHAKSYKRTPSVEIIGVCDVSDAALDLFQETHGAMQTFHDADELLALDGLDLISICTSNDMHHPIVMAAIDRGVDIYCEKPLALDLAQAQEMYDGAVAKGLKTGVNFSHRRTPAARLAKEIVDSGALGHIHYASAIYAAGSPTYAEAKATWRNDKEKAGYGGLGDMGSHVMDMLRWMLQTDITDVAATLETCYPDKISAYTGEPTTVTTEDQGILMVKYANGAMGNIYGGYVFTGRGYDQRIEVYGANGGLIYDQQRAYELQVHLPEDTLKAYTILREGGTRDTPYTTIAVPERHLGLGDGERRTVLMDFVDAYRAPGAFSWSPSFYEGLKVQEILEATTRADTARCWISLPL